MTQIERCANSNDGELLKNVYSTTRVRNTKRYYTRPIVQMHFVMLFTVISVNLTDCNKLRTPHRCMHLLITFLAYNEVKTNTQKTLGQYCILIVWFYRCANATYRAHASLNYKRKVNLNSPQHNSMRKNEEEATTRVIQPCQKPEKHSIALLLFVLLLRQVGGSEITASHSLFLTRIRSRVNDDDDDASTVVSSHVVVVTFDRA